MNLVREVGRKRLRKWRPSAIPSGMDFDIDVAGGAIDRNEGVALVALQGRQMLEVDMDKANTGRLEEADLGLVGFGASLTPWRCRQRWMALRDTCIDATPYHLDDVVERQLQRCPQFADQPLFKRGQTGLQGLGRMRAGPPRCCGRANDESWSR